MEKEYRLSTEAVLEELETTELGLSSEEAAKRLEKYGHKKRKKPLGSKDSWHS